MRRSQSAVAALLLLALLSSAGWAGDPASTGASDMAQATRSNVVAATFKLPPQGQQSMTRKVQQACPRGQGSCSNGYQTWCCPTYPNYPNCSCGNYPGTCSGRCN